MVVLEKKIYLFNITVSVNIRILVNKKTFKTHTPTIFSISWLLSSEKGKTLLYNNLEFLAHKDTFIKFG